MRRAAILLLLTVILGTSTAHAQLLTLGLRGGVSRATMSLSTGSPSTRSGILVGPTAMLWLGNVVAIQFDALYVGWGFKDNPSAAVTTGLDLSYLEVPIMAVVHLPAAGRAMLQGRLLAGTSFGFRVRCNVNQVGSDVTGISDCNPENVGTFDVGFVAGGGIKLGRGRGGLVLDATYTFGVLDANLRSDIAARNRALMISAGFVFPII